MGDAGRVFRGRVRNRLVRLFGPVPNQAMSMNILCLGMAADRLVWTTYLAEVGKDVANEDNGRGVDSIQRVALPILEREPVS